MHSFRNDYSEGCHPAVLAALTRTNLDQTPGYTDDPYCDSARAAMRAAIAADDPKGLLAKAGINPAELQIEFVPGGTMANLMVISCALRPWECVIAAPDGHINVHETGAIEGHGHKVVTTADPDGLVSVEGVEAVVKYHCYGDNYHMVKPRIIYFSLATETGMVHTAAQLHALREYADAHDLLIYIDGARLACGFASETCDCTLGDVYSVADAFTFGGTKNGALFGEAVVIRNPVIGTGFRNYMKQQGAIMAKGRIYGVQFDALFNTTGREAGVAEAQGDESLYFALGRHSVGMALRVRELLTKHGFGQFTSESDTNQQFILVDNDLADVFAEQFGCEICGWPDDEHTIVRFVCSWATTDEHLAELDEALAALER